MSQIKWETVNGKKSTKWNEIEFQDVGKKMNSSAICWKFWKCTSDLSHFCDKQFEWPLVYKLSLFYFNMKPIRRKITKTCKFNRFDSLGILFSCHLEDATILKHFYFQIWPFYSWFWNNALFSGFVIHSCVICE